jgi:hypothetical protein
MNWFDCSFLDAWIFESSRSARAGWVAMRVAKRGLPVPDRGPPPAFRAPRQGTKAAKGLSSLIISIKDRTIGKT